MFWSNRVKSARKCFKKWTIERQAKKNCTSKSYKETGKALKYILPKNDHCTRWKGPCTILNLWLFVWSSRERVCPQVKVDQSVRKNMLGLSSNFSTKEIETDTQVRCLFKNCMHCFLCYLWVLKSYLFQEILQWGNRVDGTNFQKVRIWNLLVYFSQCFVPGGQP